MVKACGTEPFTQCNAFTNRDYCSSFILSRLFYYLHQFKDCCSCLLLLQQLKCSVTLKHEVYRTGHYWVTWRERHNKIPNHTNVLPILMTQVLPESATVIFKHLKWGTTTAESIFLVLYIHPNEKSMPLSCLIPTWDHYKARILTCKSQQKECQDWCCLIYAEFSVLQITPETHTAHHKVENCRKYFFF